ncbi:GNAT family N-acetyltransferase [Streptomyces bohaiensis]|uniref:GNAT family N-acetyltransferase n=1 Tax=Streptomyces bohaiensis TaxID=1431344 RepID=A0ABX1CE07_9ACTN|nr:GNAT family N-acetyltransferase [Streptomyces bohaiensis]NJQ14554.1 GNAT family N-acetyltransferase [Streptomyces bohaiensis]
MKTEPVIVRPLLPGDLPLLADLLVKVHAVDGYPVEGVADPTVWVSSPAVLRSWVAELDGVVVGHVALMAADGEDAARLIRKGDRDESFAADELRALARLFVSPDARNRSVGRLLVRTVMDHAQAAGQRLVLDVLHKDQAATRLYRRLGWRYLGDTDHLHNGGSAPAACYSWPG